MALDRNVNVHLIDGEELDDAVAEDVLGSMDGTLVPGGFGVRAFEGKIAAARYARTHGVPYLGICLGLQAAVCEFARDVAGMPKASSAEFDAELEYPVIDLMPDQADVDAKGGTQRLGSYPCKIEPGTLAHRVYGEDLISERHRHRYEVNNAFRQQLVDAGLTVSGNLAGRPARRDDRDRRPSLLHRESGPSRVQVASHAPASAVPWPCARRHRTRGRIVGFHDTQGAPT